MAAAMAVSDEAARELLVDLVSIPSVSGDERKAAERLVAFFGTHDREAWVDDVGNVRAPGDDAVLLTSHVDTVPGDIPVRVEREAEPPGRQVGDGDAKVLWGRGSVDATGPLAAMAVAAVRTGVSFAGVVREETDSGGARHLVADREAPDAVVNGEPSGWNGVTLGYRGFLPGTFHAETPAGHSSRPDRNAIQHVMNWWADVEARFDEDGPVFEQVTAKPTGVTGGVAEDGLSVTATADVQFRVPPGTSVGEVQDVVEDALSVGRLEWDDPIPPVLESPRTPVARAFRAAIRREGGEPRLLRKTGTSDMNLYAAAWDCPMVTYGPGDSALDHAPDERLALAEFDRSVAVLEQVSEKLANDQA
ncbi:[LysW]-lysine hydrolase [Halobacteriaceae archaeon GCM10025711]